MSLATSYVEANKFTTQLLQVRYRVKQVVTDRLSYFEIHRYATKSYGYLGMTRSAAESCQEAKIAQYTRETKQWTYIEDGENSRFTPTATRECMASVTASPNGIAWEVHIDVNEDDVALSMEAPADPAALFTAINSRSYDEGATNDGLQLLGANRTKFGLQDAITVAFKQNIDGFDGDNLSAEIASSSSDAFTTLSRATASGFVFHGGTIPSPVYVRLVYGNYISNVVEVP